MLMVAVLCVAGVCAMAGSSGPTKAWSYQITESNVSINGWFADAKGGCVVLYRNNEDSNYHYFLVWLDKAGKELLKRELWGIGTGYSFDGSRLVLGNDVNNADSSVFIFECNGKSVVEKSVATKARTYLAPDVSGGWTEGIKASSPQNKTGFFALSQNVTATAWTVEYYKY
jgi:hypothetical protein